MSEGKKKAITARSTIWLCLKFLVLAPVLLVGWLELLPFYARALGNVCAFVMKHLMDKDVQGVAVNAAGFLNTRTALEFTYMGHRLAMQDLGNLTTNVAPFIALVLATSGLRLWRRLGILAAGIAILFLSHGATIVLRLISGGRTPFATALGFLTITLPFLLWIVLAYWDKLSVFLSEEGSGSTAKPE